MNIALCFIFDRTVIILAVTLTSFSCCESHGYTYIKNCKTQITQIREPNQWEINTKSSLTMTVLELHQG